MTIVLGIDPGSVNVGIVVREGRDVLAHRVLVNPHTPRFPATTEWITDVLTAAQTLAVVHHPDLVAVESLANPRWHRGGEVRPLNPTHLIATAQVVGALQGTFAGVSLVMVPPGKMGSAPLGYYPDPLVSDGERRLVGWQKRIGSGNLRHARSAWDVAGNALTLHAAS